MAKRIELSEKQLERFNKCYGVYRKKVARGQAETTWRKLDPDDELTNTIFEAILSQNRAEELYCERRFYRNFSTWLNAMGWKDEIPELTEKPQEKREYKIAGWYEEKHRKAAENYCIGNGLYVRGVTGRHEAKHNMAQHMAKKLGKRVFKKMFPKLAGYL